MVPKPFYPPPASPLPPLGRDGKVKFMDRTWDTAFGSIGPRTFFRKEYIKHWILIIILSIIAAILVIFHKQIVVWLQPFATDLKDIKFGWLIPVGILFVISFPPLFGHEIVTILCGLVWGLWVGFGIVALGTFLGELGNFVLFKYACTRRSQKYEHNNLSYACMCIIVREGGFWIALLARLSAIPGHLVTPVFATTGMSLLIFCAATILTLPKQFAGVYLGTLFEETGPKSTRQDIVEYTVLGIAFIVTVGSAVYIYIKMGKKRPEVEKVWAARDAANIAVVGGAHTVSMTPFAGGATPGIAVHAPSNEDLRYTDSYAQQQGRPRQRYDDPLDPRAHYRQSDGWSTRPIRDQLSGDGYTDEGKSGLVANAARPGYSGIGARSTSSVDLNTPSEEERYSGESEESLAYDAGRGNEYRQDSAYEGGPRSEGGQEYQGTSYGALAPTVEPPPSTTPTITFRPASAPEDSILAPVGDPAFFEPHTHHPPTSSPPWQRHADLEDDEMFYRPRGTAPSPPTGVPPGIGAGPVER